MSEAKDPAFKLFGKTIPVAEVPVSSGGSTGASALACATSIGDNMDQDDHASKANSSSDVNTNKDEENGEADKVRDFLRKILILRDDPLF